MTESVFHHPTLYSLNSLGDTPLPHTHSIIRGDPIAQLVLEKVSLPVLKRVKELPPTARGVQGCGS